MIVDSGKSDLAANYIKTHYRRIKVGVGSDDTTSGSVDLDSPVVNSSGVVLATDNIVPSHENSRLAWTISFTGSQLGTQGISELGIFKQTSDATNDTMLSRVTFTNTGVIAASDTITFVIEMEVN
jgi:hypothetical protein|tara:strand:- start:10412 stop:10786 length:375 start_codon:yes stop_codon:yes gene_type:complete